MVIGRARRALRRRPNWTSGRFIAGVGVASAVIGLPVWRFWHSTWPLMPIVLPTAVATVAIGALIYRELIDIDFDSKREVDRRLFEQFQQLLPASGPTMKLLRDHWFEYGFRLDDIAPLDRLSLQWNDADHRFHDPAIQNAFDRFYAKVHDVLIGIGTHTFPHRNDDYQKFYPDVSDLSDDWDSHYKPLVDKINADTTEAWKLHQEFVLVARRRLGV